MKIKINFCIYYAIFSLLLKKKKTKHYLEKKTNNSQNLCKWLGNNFKSFTKHSFLKIFYKIKKFIFSYINSKKGINALIFIKFQSKEINFCIEHAKFGL